MYKWGLLASSLGFFFLAAFFTSKQEDKHRLAFSGNIETNEIALSFQVSGRIKTRPLDEGDKAEANQIAATLDQEPYLIDFKKKEALVKVYEKELEELENGYPKREIEEALYEYDRAKAHFTYQESEFKRTDKLFSEEAISDKEHDLSSSLYYAEKASTKAAEEHYLFLKEGYRKEKIEQAKARLEAAKADRDLAQFHLKECTLKTPAKGVVLSKHHEPGEVVEKAAPILTLGRLDAVYFRAYIDEPDLGKVKLGQTVFVNTDSYPGKNYKGKISFISSEAEFTPRNIQTKKERVKTVWMIKVDLENPEDELKPGMPADGYVLVQDS